MPTDAAPLMPVPKARWIPDATSDRCTACAAAFGLLLRRHHCRACGGLFCHMCSSKRLHLQDGAEHRACHGCHANAQRPHVQLSEAVEANLQRFQRENEINPKFMPSLRTLALYDVVLVCDDSGSMCGPADPKAPGVSRWDELKQAVRLIMSAAAALEKPVDIYFLNRGKYLNVTAFGDVEGAFHRAPSGLTPLTHTLREVWKERKVRDDMRRDLVVYAFTDGYPSTFSGAADIDGFEGWLSYRAALRRTFIAICLCTDEEEIVNEYRRFEYREQGKFGWSGPTVGVLGVDVTEDYRGEVRDIKATRGPSYRFSFGDYIVKCLVGCVDPMVHAVDLPPGMDIYGGSGDCTIM